LGITTRALLQQGHYYNMGITTTADHSQGSAGFSRIQQAGAKDAILVV
jgi:hypothetical protein